MPSTFLQAAMSVVAAAVLVYQAPYVVGVLICPRRTGRRLARVPLWRGVVVHLACLVAAWYTLMLCGQLILRVRLPGSGQFIQLFRLLAEELLSLTSDRLSGASRAVSLIVLVSLGEAYYWSLGIVTLGGWSGVTLKPVKQAARMAVTAGYASVWLVVLAGGWGLAGLLLRLSERGPGLLGFAGDLQFWSVVCITGACALLSVLPAFTVAMALRLASGVGDSLGRPQPPEDKLCEFCGYNLHAASFEQRCPECGHPASMSMAAVGRAPDWEARQRRYAPTLLEFLLLPGRFFRRVPVRRGLDAARRFLVLSAVVSAIPFALGAMASVVVRYAMRGGGDGLEGAWLQGLYIAVLAAGGWVMAVIVASMAAASVLAGTSRRRRDRLGGYGAAKLACYLAGLAIPWSLLVATMSVGTEYLRELLRPAGGLAETTYTLAWVTFAALLLVWYWIIGSRAYESTQFANS